MAQKIRWENYTQVEDLAVNVGYLKSCIGEPDPVTGCCPIVKGGRHKQGYLMILARYADEIGEQGGVSKLMVTGHRVLARLKYKTPITPKDKVYHTCGNMACMNIDHIAVGSPQDVHDMMTRLQLHQGGWGLREHKEHGDRSEGYQSGRKYKYTIQQVLDARVMDRQQLQDKYNLSMWEAQRLHKTGRGGYKWVDMWDPNKTTTPKPMVDIQTGLTK